jgi:hypothetical protein
MRRALRWLLFTSIGAVVGTGLGLLANLALVKACVALSPKDPSAASVGILCIVFVPGGFLWGASLGAARAKRVSE